MKSMLALFVLASSSAYGMVYTWTDSGGIVHFSNKEYEIPTRYRAKAKALYPEQADTSAPQQHGQAQQSKPDAPPPAPAQQAKPEEAAKTIPPPAIAPEPRKSAPEHPVKRGRRSRHSTPPEDE